jgi:hypothetical protein
MINKVNRGTSLRNCISLALQIGCVVENVPGTGETRFGHRAVGRSVRVNGRKKDAPRSLISWLNRLP